MNVKAGDETSMKKQLCEQLLLLLFLKNMINLLKENIEPNHVIQVESN